MNEATDVTEVIEPGDADALALVDVDGKCPFGYYKAARARASVAFEEPTGKWVAATYSAVSKVLTDEQTFPRLLPEEIVSDPKYARTVAIPSFLTGEERLKHHRWWLDIFNARELKRYREGIVTSVVDTVIDRLAKAGYARRLDDPNDRRRVLVELTPLARERAGAIWGPLAQLHAALASYTVQELTLLRDYLSHAPDPERGQIVQAHVVLATGVAADAETTRRLQDHVKATIAPFKYPRSVKFATALPKTQTGKIQRFQLRNQE